jgi:fluoride ion exporter CrcB/FEX
MQNIHSFLLSAFAGLLQLCLRLYSSQITLLENKQLLIFAINILTNVGLSLGALILGRTLTSFVLMR